MNGKYEKNVAMLQREESADADVRFILSRPVRDFAIHDRVQKSSFW
jgi:hypothetical protein